MGTHESRSASMMPRGSNWATWCPRIYREWQQYRAHPGQEEGRRTQHATRSWKKVGGWRSTELGSKRGQEGRKRKGRWRYKSQTESMTKRRGRREGGWEGKATLTPQSGSSSLVRVRRSHRHPGSRHSPEHHQNSQSWFPEDPNGHCDAPSPEHEHITPLWV